MAGFRCPFCGQNMSIAHSTHVEHRISFSSSNCDLRAPHLRIEIYRCPNDSCRKETILAFGENNYIENNSVLIYPESGSIQFPEYVPKAIRQDYEEACSILRKSPKASATLSRRCLQGMIRDFWGIKKNRLIDEIQALQDKVPAAQWAAIDALRQLGNIGAHMEKDVNTMIDVDTGEAESLLSLIELLIQKWYINRNDEQELYKRITEASAAKKNSST